MKRSISTKITLSYIVIILVSVLFSGILYRMTAIRYLEKQAESNLYNDARVLSDYARSASGNLPKEQASGGLNKLRQFIKDIKGLRGLDSQWAMIDGKYKVINPLQGNNAQEFNEEILPSVTFQMEQGSIKKVFSINNGGIEYMSVIYPISSAASAANARYLVLYISVGTVKQLAGGLLLVMIISSALTGIVAVIFGIFFARSIAKPVIALKIQAERLAMRNFDTKLDIRTGDELEDLAESFDTMTKRFKEYDVSQKRFIQNASHELKTPLMSIQGYAEGIKDGVFDDRSHALDVIIEESIRLKGIVDEVIFLSKLETMDDFYIFADHGINGLLERTVEKVNSIALKKNVTINTAFYKDAVIKIDGDKMTQAFINLIGNCIRYAKNEVGIVTSNDGRKFEILIYDDGEGFGENDLKHVFERFYKGRKGDTGLGLAISKVIIEKHGGVVSAENRPDGGAQFRLALPLERGIGA